eukprot:TRINITY_DN3790_c0_g2_i1.p2 TRINITY_DN3790_c0_g2~~TRINITY_DN3790_c0_g2_i1.p2  ORF type:complete len:136 (-),score=30.31 TRINITY_DN3790_c0_g2_i1:685-1092(-)
MPNQNQNNFREQQIYEQTVQNLLQMCGDDKLSVVRNYLTSATAKDMAVVIALQQCSSDGFLGNNLYESSSRFQCMLNEGGEGEGGYHGIIWDQMYDVCFLYKVSLLDLDKKSVAKIFAHKKQDQKIVDCARKNIQ